MESGKIIVVFAIGLVLSLSFTRFLIPVLVKMKAGQNIREEGPESHQAKAGTPSMGGIGIIAAITITTLAYFRYFGENYKAVLVVLAAMIAYGLMGFSDDYLKVKRRHNQGLSAKQKLALQIIIALGIAWYQYYLTPEKGSVCIPFTGFELDFGFMYIPFIVFVIVAMANSVNLTDGLDGLAGGVTEFVAIFFGIAGFLAGFDGPSIFCMAVAGSCLGFLFYNKHPAKVFMGDTGSLALGGGLATVAVIMRMELLLPLVGIVYVMEALSVILQVGSFKLRKGKRIFKMSPLHHHFELSGMAEQNVVKMFVGITFLACIVTALILRFI